MVDLGKNIEKRLYEKIPRTSLMSVYGSTLLSIRNQIYLNFSHESPIRSIKFTLGSRIEDQVMVELFK